MKTMAVSLLLIIIGLGIGNAQYKIDKTKYDFKTWTYEEGDPYNPVTCGVLSIIPGVGQMVAHECGRGAAFLGGAAGCFLFSVTGFGVAFGSNEELGGGMIIVGLLGIAAIDIWSIIDATRVAKVKNLAWRDRNNTGFNLHMEPYISPIQTIGSTKTQVGLSLKVHF